MAEPVTEQQVAQQSVAGLPAAEALPPEHMTPGDLTPDDPANSGPPQAAATQAVAAQAAGENFPVALRMLPRRHRQLLMAVYVFARTADDTGDEAPAAERLRLLAELEEDVRRLYASLGESSGLSSGEGSTEEDTGPPRLAAVRGLARAVTECEIPIQPFVDLIRANQQDQVVTRYQTFDDLVGYCKLSANPVGRIVLHVFGSFSAVRAEQSDLICTGLQLAEHWQDVAEDFRAGRIYLPLEDLAVHGCTEQDLAARQTAPLVRELMAFEVGRARSLIDTGAPLIGTLRGAARAAVAGYVAGGRAALAAIAAADYDVLARTPRPGKARTAGELARAFARGR
ncbi:MAG TPA: squalene synthase HpnC [Streptosporangiaceae bacterium]|nr:squalene synthase HpnC [Streptosporangiaceae bacterium]